MSPDEIIEAYNVVVQDLNNTTAQEAARIGNAQVSLGTMAERVARPSGMTSGLANYTYNRTMRPVVEQSAAALTTNGLAQALQNTLTTGIREAKNRYEDAKNAYTIASTSPSGGGGSDNKYREQTDNEFTGKLVPEEVKTVQQKNNAFNNRGRFREQDIEVIKDNNGNVSILKVNGIPHYGREARARYRYYKRQGLTK